MKSPAQIFRSVLSHVLWWGETYVALPVVLGMLLAGVWLVNVLTGRAPLEDAGAVVGWLLNAVGVCVVVSLAGLVQYFLFGYRARHDAGVPPLKDDIHDSCVTCFLLLLFAVLIFGLIR